MPVMPSPRRLGLLVLAIAAVAALWPLAVARAQVNFSEPPDMTDNLNSPDPAGTVAVGLNTVAGRVSATWANFGGAGGDNADAFSFIVPPGHAVTGIQIVVSNFTCTNCVAKARSFSDSIGVADITGNGTITLPISGPLGPGTYNAQVYVDANPADSIGSGSYSYQFRISVIAATNDLCQLATPIGLGSTPFNTTGATTDGLPHAGACNFFGFPSIVNDLWYTFTPTASGELTISTCGPGGGAFDTEVNVYGSTACPGTDATLLACNDDSPACGAFPSQSQVVITANAGQTYLIRVGGYDGAGGTSGAGTLTIGLVTTGACCNRRTGGCLVLSLLDCQALGLTFQTFGSTCSPNPCVACPGDFNDNGALSIDDIFSFLNAWFAGCP